MFSWEHNGRRRGCCSVFSCTWTASGAPFTGGYIVCSYMIAFTIVSGSFFPCILPLCLAFRRPHMELAGGSSQASKGVILRPT